MPAYLHDTVDTPTTSVLSAGLQLPITYKVGTVDTSIATFAGVSTVGGIFVPMNITSYNQVTKNPKTNVSQVIPIINFEGAGHAYGGSIVGEGGHELAKLSVEGTIDTPTTNVSGMELPALTVDGIRMQFAELVLMYIEGRAAVTNNAWSRVNPLWFRDPYHRKYSFPRITEFTAGYVEAVPGRTTFSMKVVV